VSPTGSKTAAWYQTENLELGKTRMPSQNGVCDIKPINGKILQTAFRESDQFVVPLKQGNSFGGKGLTEVRVTLGSHLTHPEVKKKMTTKLTSKTQKAIQVIALKAKEDPNCKFTSLAHLLAEDFLNECFRELKKNKFSRY